ncbi:hypothetical protein DICPUDRAFT_157146 [Dictyostelium purpureum]|uniref:Glycine--tRNA ligase n=1 Tax=Dictyostelium purpureum TaxID=5786 RepID=F0ZYD5_DICPU|nr:uncharacterized protein DICPUDRAFT_157146 [Dictyostelium purpureum]EGC31046.1 hypothetical protein DICPUDRAFT_157146 [Dictyostelium purpureum]|eukprot:XP_003292434.1 hypothetical protein DICPUDRAFT_157146 [Dictyostelium purpureum]
MLFRRLLSGRNNNIINNCIKSINQNKSSILLLNNKSPNFNYNFNFTTTTTTTTLSRFNIVGPNLEKNMENKEKIRNGLEELMKRRFFITPAFQIYRGVAGLYDYGPPGCAVKANLINYWRQHFVLNEDMSEVDCTSVTPEIVLKTSGHVAKFSDFMVKDEVTKLYFRADHVLEGHIEKLLLDTKLTEDKVKELKHVLTKAGDYNQQELKEALVKYNVKAPETGNALSDPYPFNLMFKTEIGPSGNNPGYLRPETAQGIFVNFAKLYEFNGKKLPFAAAQIGNAFRNEIAPRSGLLRVREFTMAEIEHFVNPNEKTHPKFQEVANDKVFLLSSEAQDTTKEIIETTFGDAVSKGLIDNETLAYFMARTQLFLHTVGIKPAGLRFRQHQRNEMAHYAKDCWDAEILTTYGWIECVGHADRSCYDLTVHANESKANLTVYEEFKDGPKMIDIAVIDVKKQLMGKQFKQAAKAPMEYLAGLKDKVDEAMQIQEALNTTGSYVLNIDGQEFTLTKEMVTITKGQEKKSGKNYYPHVIEPSFGLGRIIYALLEQNYWTRENDEQRGVLSLPAIIAPVKASILPLTNSEKLVPFVAKISKLLKEAGISTKLDDTGNAIGRKYARTDEIGIPFGITIDFTTVEDETVTLRERDTTKQIRIPITDLALTLKKLCDNTVSWSDVSKTFPAYESQSE